MPDRHHPSHRAVAARSHQRQAVQFCQLQPHGVARVEQRGDDRFRFSLSGHDLAHPRVKTADRDLADLEAERAQQVADHVLHAQHLAAHRLAPDQRRAQRLCALRLDMNRTEPTGPHHLRNAFGVTVGLVQHRVQRRLGVPALEADHGTALFGKRREQPGAVRERFQADALEVDSLFRQEQFDRVRIGLECPSWTTLLSPSTTQTFVACSDTSSPA
ncbi:hypothetical protein IVA80_31770 [Bradyrhizobium sp. 139]|uniref:hypothetical protein n=1 Tax=Bradyrhizobium sp. 139 TaxID=2782616 RepID=UPI001FF99018|nr:hypothetical protein [Bradyrhizobium sp. 139]MCK1745248.1 hypothetical protein [Bradyrhizobium sp. 139]